MVVVKAEHSSNHVHLNVNPFRRLKLHIRTERSPGDSLKIVTDNEFFACVDLMLQVV